MIGTVKRRTSRGKMIRRRNTVSIWKEKKTGKRK